MPAEGRDGLWEEKNNWREPKLLWKLDFYWRKAKAWWHEDVYGISNVSWSHDLNRAKHKSLINAELCLTPQVGWERVHQVNVPGCCTCLFGSTSVGRKEKQATLCREGELNLFTILETWWNSQLQTGTKTNKKDTTTQTLGQTVCSDQCHTPPACETRSQNERIQSCINPSCSRPLWLDDRNKNRHTLVSTHTKEKLKRAFLKHSLLFSTHPGWFAYFGNFSLLQGTLSQQEQAESEKLQRESWRRVAAGAETWRCGLWWHHCSPEMLSVVCVWRLITKLRWSLQYHSHNSRSDQDLFFFFLQPTGRIYWGTTIVTS